MEVNVILMSVIYFMYNQLFRKWVKGTQDGSGKCIVRNLRKNSMEVNEKN